MGKGWRRAGNALGGTWLVTYIRVLGTVDKNCLTQTHPHSLTHMYTWKATVRSGRGAQRLEPLLPSSLSPCAMDLGWYFEVSWAGLGTR